MTQRKQTFPTLPAPVAFAAPQQIQELMDDVSREIQDLVRHINLIAEGRSNSVGSFTLEAGTQTTVENMMFESEMIPVFTPISAEPPMIWLVQRARGAFTVGHDGGNGGKQFLYFYAG